MSWSANASNTSQRSMSYPDTQPTTPLTTRSNTTSSVSSVSPVIDYAQNASNFGDNITLNLEVSTKITSEPNKERTTVASACVQCRSKHLKCDGSTPCSRCSINNFECVYVRSRRGFKGPRRNGTSIRATSGSGSSDKQVCSMVNPGTRRATSIVSTGLVTPPEQRQTTFARTPDQPLFDPSQDILFDPAKQIVPNMSLSERCIEAYFHYFHPAHPVVVPRDFFMQLRRERQLPHLEAAMRYVGSFYVPQASTTVYQEEAERILYSPNCPRDAFRVQAMLVMCIGLDGSANQDLALKVLLEAQDQALEIGMNRREFASMNAGSSPVVAESFRRTWWELFVVDGMIAGVHQKSGFGMKDIPADVVLPCEEDEYNSGHIPQLARTWEDYENDGFDDSQTTFSSYVYRIAALYNLGHVLTSGIMVIPDEEIIDRLDARMVAWRLHLPDSKRDFIKQDGKLDEMLFQAHMITEATTVLLHRDHSQLGSEMTRSIDACAPHKDILPGPSFNNHAAKTIKAAQAISKLIQLPVPLVKHTHFFTCVVTLASIVHLMCWGAMMPLTYDDDLKQQLRLSTGSLKTLWQVWPAAGKAFGQVKGVAQDIFTSKKQVLESAFTYGFAHDRLTRGLIEDEVILNELQLLV